MNMINFTTCLAGMLLSALVHAQAASVPANEVMQKATAISLGNMAWESVAVSEAKIEGAKVKWLATTPTGKWNCVADVDGKRPYCER